MAKKDLKTALKGSLVKEEKSVSDRFEKAETLFSVKESGTTNRTPSADEKTTGSDDAEQSKVIRDSFTMPQTDYDLIGLLRKRCLGFGVEITKSEILRAGIKALEQMPDEEFFSKLSSVEKVKTGRRKQTS